MSLNEKVEEYEKIKNEDSILFFAAAIFRLFFKGLSYPTSYIMRRILDQNFFLTVLSFVMLSVGLVAYNEDYLYVVEVFKGCIICYCMTIVIQNAMHMLMYKIVREIKTGISKVAIYITIADAALFMIFVLNLFLKYYKVILSSTALVSFITTYAMYTVGATFCTKLADIVADTRAKLILSDIANEDMIDDDISRLDNLGDVISEGYILCMNFIIINIFLSDLLTHNTIFIGQYLIIRLASALANQLVKRRVIKLDNHFIFVAAVAVVVNSMIHFYYFKGFYTLAVMYSVASVVVTAIYYNIKLLSSHIRKTLGSVDIIFNSLYYAAISVVSSVMMVMVLRKLLVSTRNNLFTDVKFSCLTTCLSLALLTALIGSISDCVEGLLVKQMGKDVTLYVENMRYLDTLDSRGNVQKIVMKSINIMCILLIMDSIMPIGNIVSMNINLLSCILPIGFISILKVVQNANYNISSIFSNGYNKNLYMFVPILTVMLYKSSVGLGHFNDILCYCTLGLLTTILGGVFDVVKKESEMTKDALHYRDMVRLDLLGDFLKDVANPIYTVLALLLLSLCMIK